MANYDDAAKCKKENDIWTHFSFLTLSDEVALLKDLNEIFFP